MMADGAWRGWLRPNKSTIISSQDLSRLGRGHYLANGPHPQFTFHQVNPNRPLAAHFLRLRFRLTGHLGLRPEISLGTSAGQEVAEHGRRLCEVTAKGMVDEFMTIPENTFFLRVTLPSQAGLTVENFTLTLVSPQRMHLWHVWSRLRLTLISPSFFCDACRSLYDIYRGEGWPGIWAGVARDRRALGVSGGERSEADMATEAQKYPLWFAKYGVLSTKQKKRLTSTITKLAARPLISILIAVDRQTTSKRLTASISSISRQLYPNWEVVIAGDRPISDMQALLEDQGLRDQRIHWLEASGQEASRLNAALAGAKGQFAAFLHPGDVLTEDALYWAALAINREDEAAIIYTDEDRTDEAGNLSAPHCKPDWNPPLLYCQHLPGQLALYRLDLIREAGGLNDCLGDAYEWGLALRMWGRLRRSQVVHIPRIVSHRLTTDEGRESRFSPHAAEALADFFAQQSIEVAILPGQGQQPWRVRYVVREFPKVSIIIPNHNALPLIQACLQSIFQKTKYPDYEVIVVDNRSDDPEVLRYLGDLEKNKSIRLLSFDQEFNFSAINNLAAEQARGQFLCLMNNDIQVISEDWLLEMISQAMQAKVGAVGAKLYYPDDTIQHCGVVTGIRGVAAHLYAKLPRNFAGPRGRNFLVQQVSVVTAACLVVSKAIYQEVGGLEEGLAGAFNDIDFCLKVREAGYDNLWTPFAELYHHESVSRGYDVTPERYALFRKAVRYMKQTWEHTLAHDPYYNPNLTLRRNDGSMAWPPRRETSK